MSETTTYKLRTPDISGILVDLYNIEGYKDSLFIEIGNYFYIENQEDGSIEPEDCYTTVNRNDSLAFFRIWLEKSGVVYKEEMVSLLKHGNYNIAGLVLLSWMREVFDIDPTISWVKMSIKDWETVLSVLTCIAYVRE